MERLPIVYTTHITEGYHIWYSHSNSMNLAQAMFGVSLIIQGTAWNNQHVNADAKKTSVTDIKLVDHHLHHRHTVCMDNFYNCLELS
jgi:hypothetical protein